MNTWQFVNQWGYVDPDTQTDVAATAFFLLLSWLTVYRFAVKREQARHRCPPPTVQIVERPHDPWQPTPWVCVDQLEDPEVPN